MAQDLRTIHSDMDIACNVADCVFRKLNETKDEPRSGVPGEPLAVISGINEVTVRFTIEAATKLVTVRAAYVVKDSNGAVVSEIAFGSDYDVQLVEIKEETVEPVEG